MALEKTTTTPHGFAAVNAYHRVEGTQVNKDTMTFQVRSYKDNSGLPHFADAPFNCSYDLNGDNPIKQAYEHLKTLPEFAGAADV
jgi:galactose mutarotase-like enzyme